MSEGGAPHVTERLGRVIRAIEATTDHTPASLAAALAVPIGIEDISPWIRFDPRDYVRSLVMRTDHWELRLSCWRPGQSTSMHAHGPAACAFRVVRGSATETVLGARDRTLAAGDVIAEVGPALVHQVSNRELDPLLTLHAYCPRLPVDAPSPRDGRNIVIVGGGFSGIAAAVHVLRRATRDVRVTVVERGPWLGRGIAYGVESDVFRLNVPASKMSLDPDVRDDFVRWAASEDAPHAFLPRARYGAYVVERLADAIRASAGKLRVVRGEVAQIDATSVGLTDGTRLAAETVIVATGLAPRLVSSGLPADPRIIDAWDEAALSTVPREGRILILGSGLTALDVIAFLNGHGFRGAVSVVSRRGLLPARHAPHGSPVAPLADDVVAAAPSTLRELIRWGRARVVDAVRSGAPWQHALDAIRPHVATLWRGLSPADRVRFVEAVRPYWDVLRHRAPEDMHALVESWQHEGRLERIAGSVVACEPATDQLRVTLRVAGGSTRVVGCHAIVRCLGPALARREGDTPLLRSLIESGQAAPDPAGLGIVTDAHGRIVGGDGTPSSRLFALGALRRASSWETTAVPDIAVHAAELARMILGGV
jgi:uncharacterized NAD(P)/FAD-binding protein YdhS/quercetin dioxygenase-like cupin family protein